MKAILERLETLDENIREIKERLDLRDRRRRKKPPKWETPFLDALAVTGRVTKAIELIGSPKSPSVYYEYRNTCDDFAAKWKVACEAYQRSAANGSKEARG